MKKIIFIVSMIMIYSSCNKTSSDNNYTITAVIVDWDVKTPIPGAKVYSQKPTVFGSPIVYDSAYTDAAGKAEFTYQKGDTRLIFAVSKPGYVPNGVILYPRAVYFEDRTDTSYMARASYVDLTVHRTATYLAGDSVYVKVKGNYTPGGYSGFYTTMLKDLANSPDKLLNLPAFYSLPYNTKLFYQCDVIRSGSIFATVTDSTEMIQFGTKNHTLNY